MLLTKEYAQGFYDGINTVEVELTYALQLYQGGKNLLNLLDTFNYIVGFLAIKKEESLKEIADMNDYFDATKGHLYLVINNTKKGDGLV